MYSEEDLLDLSGLQHIAYCERQWALIHVEQVWSENLETIRGEAFHERAHCEGYTAEKGIVSIRSMPLVSYALGIKGQSDIVEIVPSADSSSEQIRDLVTVRQSGRWSSEAIASILPIEYKVGKPKLQDWDRIQVCAQGMCLEEALGVTVHEGALFYGETRHREIVSIDNGLREKTIALSRRMHELFDRGITPRVAADARCKRCSLAPQCMPEMLEGNARAYWKASQFAGYPDSGKPAQVGESI